MISMTHYRCSNERPDTISGKQGEREVPVRNRVVVGVLQPGLVQGVFFLNGCQQHPGQRVTPVTGRPETGPP